MPKKQTTMHPDSRVHELLKPRFQITNDYPGNSQEVGYIFTADASASYYRKFPAVFKELQWWEHRDEKEMPSILNHLGNIKKVKEYKWMHGGESVIFEDGTNIYISHTIPATESEYLTHIKQ